MSPEASGETLGRRAYADFINEQVHAEELRKSSIETRGGLVITTSGALVTLLFGLTGFTASQKGFILPHAAKGFLALAPLFFVASSIAALLTNLPLPYQNVKPTELQGAIHHYWEDSTAVALARVSATNVNFLNRAQKLNQLKAYVLMAAFTFEIAGVALVALGVRAIIS